MSYGNNPIEKNIEAVDITEAFTRAVGRDKIEEVRKIISWLESRGYKNPVLYGGTLRDLFIGEQEPKDYDLEVNETDIAPLTPDKMILDIHHRGAYRSSQNEHPSLRALRADAPINAISLGTDGRIYAHPNFLKHVKDKIYAIRPDLNRKQYDAALRRHNRLSSKYPDWYLAEEPTIT